MEGLSSSLTVLTAMITPAVLISASGTMILSSSTRLGRVVDRTRSLSDRLQEIFREMNVHLKVFQVSNGIAMEPASRMDKIV